MFFYDSLFDLLIKYQADSLVFLINKMSTIVSSRLMNFIYLSSSRNFDCIAFSLKYNITKYADKEASEEVIEALLNKRKTVLDIIKIIRDDMYKICQNNLSNKRMELQVSNYQRIIEIIDDVLETKAQILEPEQEIKFDWGQFKWNLEIWLDEQNYRGQICQGYIF